MNIWQVVEGLLGPLPNPKLLAGLWQKNNSCPNAARYPVLSGRISGIIWPDIRYYPAGYPVLSGQISGIIRPDIRLGN